MSILRGFTVPPFQFFPFPLATSDHDANLESAHSSDNKNDKENIDLEINIVSVEKVDTEWNKI